MVPFRSHIEAPCERGLRGLGALGYRIERSGGATSIDRARSELATRALLRDDIDEILWIDSDMGFEPASVDALRAHRLPFVGGLYSRRGPRGFTSTFPDGTNEIPVGTAGGLIAARYVATGFLLTHRRVYEDIKRFYDLPICNEAFGTPTVPYFLPMVVRDPQRGFWYMSEDWSFSERATRAGHTPMIDTSIRLWHLGTYRYGWEDVATPLGREPGLTIKMEKDEKG